MDDSEKVLRAIEGTTPSIETLNSFGCPFVNRCPVAIKECIHRFPERTTYSRSIVHIAGNMFWSIIKRNQKRR